MKNMFLRYALRYLFILGSAMLTTYNAKAQNELIIIGQKGSVKWLDQTDASNSLYHHLADQAYELLDKREGEINKLKSLPDWQKRQKQVSDILSESVGPFPEKTPLNPKITRVIKKENYRIENIIFESQPKFYVTSSLFIPGGLKKNSKAPVIIFVSGHSANGYRYGNYQNMILNLVMKGFMVFAFDPVGQGERLEYFDPKTGKSVVGGPTTEHSYPGCQAFICGSSQAKYMIWDGIRAVDYLLTRKDVDPARIGITGCSGGGTQTTFIAAMDDRILAAAPACYITSFRRLFQSIGPQDAEQNFAGGIINGIEHADLLAVRAPKPGLVMSTSEDMFSIQGAHETVREVERIYKAYGKDDYFGQTEDMGPHGTTPKTREAMYAFFQRHLNNPGSPDEEKTEPLPDEDLRVTSTGQVSTSLGGETVFSLNAAEAERLANDLGSSRNNKGQYQTKVLAAAEKLSGYKEPAEISEPVFTGQVRRDGYVIQKYFVKGEGHYVIPYLLLKPDKSGNKALIYLHPSGKSAEAAAGGEMELLVRNGFTVLAPDLIGIGEVGPGDYKGDAYIEGNSQNLWYASILIGRSIVGIRASDVARLAGILKKNEEKDEIYGIARKEMAPVLLHAAAFDKSISRVALIEPLSSWRSVAVNHFYRSSFIAGAVPGALKAYDLPDLAGTLAPRKLIMVGTTDGNGKTDTDGIGGDMALVKIAYDSANAGGELVIAPENTPEELKKILTDWLK